MTGWRAALLAACVLGCATAAAIAGGPYRGQPLAAALASLQRSGVRVIFSTDLVRPDMIVRQEPRGRWPREVLHDLLEPHGLRARRGPTGTFLVVRAPRPPARPGSTGSTTRSIVFERIGVRAGDGPADARDPEVRESLDASGAAPLATSPVDPLSPLAPVASATSLEGSGDLHVRGSAGREVKVLLDGLQLYEPYHLKERGGPIGIVDARAVGTIGVLPGAFPAEYGGTAGAVIEMDTMSPAAPLRTTVSASADDTRVASQGALGERAEWMIAARRGDPSRVLDALGADPSYQPRYWDVVGKVVVRPDDRSTVALHLLAGDDDLEGGDDLPVQTLLEPGTFRSRRSSRYLWASHARAWSERLFARTIVSTARLASDRSGSSPRVESVADLREARVHGISQDWLLEAGAHLLKWGAEARRVEARYDYRVDRLDGAPVAIGGAPAGTELGAYVADRVRLSGQLDVELGLRWDRQGYVPGADGMLSPRVNARWALTDRTSLRAGWGRFHQAQRIHELQVEDGRDRFLPPERAEHRLLSLDHRTPAGVHARASAYQKRTRAPHRRFENLFDPFGLFPETDADRVEIVADAARAEGVELFVRGPAPRRVAWWAGYALGRVQDRVGGAWVARAWDQRHAAGAGARLTLGHGWEVAVAGRFHSGWPTTPVTGELVVLPDGTREVLPVMGPRNTARLPAWTRIDLRLGRVLRLGGSAVRAQVGVTNLLDAANPCCLGGLDLVTQQDGTVAVHRTLRPGLPRMVSLELAWSF